MVSTNPGSSSTKRMRELMLKLRWSGWDANDELSALHRLAVHLNAASVRFHDFFHQIQSQAGTVHLVRQGAATAEKRLENMLALIGRDARPAVHYTDLDGAA